MILVEFHLSLSSFPPNIKHLVTAPQMRLKKCMSVYYLNHFFNTQQYLTLLITDIKLIEHVITGMIIL